MNGRWLLGIIAMLTSFCPETFAQRSEARSLLGDPGSWKRIASEGVNIEVRAEGPAMRIDFDFSRGAGYGGAFLDLPMDLPENYQIVLNVRGKGPANNLELKLVDPDGLN